LKILKGVLYGFMALVLAGGWAFLYWQSSAVDLATGDAARSALGGLRAIDARWNDQLIGARLSSASGAPFRPAQHRRAYSDLEVKALSLQHPALGLALRGAKQAFDDKSVLMARVAAGEPLFDQAWLVPTGPRLDTLSRALDRAFDDALGRAEMHRVWLLYYSAFLLTILAYALWELYLAKAGLERRVAERTAELSEALQKLKESEAMLVQSEKMSSLGQMVAGLAHEINTPLAYAKASLEAVRSGVSGAGKIAAETRTLLALLSGETQDEAALAAQFEVVRALVQDERARKAFEALETQVKDGVHGISEIAGLVANLKDFSRLDRSRVAQVDLHEGIESTLRIAQQHLGRRKVEKEFGRIPAVAWSTRSCST
jgi:C4-dicarboxylate-specific signal transduction histidine kinase